MSKIKFTTPKGDLRWVTINGRGKEDLQGNMTYTADVVVPLDAAQDTIAELDALWNEHKPKGAKAAKSMGYKHIADDYVVFTLKTKTVFPSGDPKKIFVYNAKAQQIAFPEGKKIGNGSVGRLSGMASVYDAGAASRGVTLYLDAIQLTKFVEYVGASADFKEDDDGEFDGLDDQMFVAEDLV
tara:strand:- start:4266 stop:4814 length:549 start_codon:yes stop_codon:yes gene_type:complete